MNSSAAVRHTDPSWHCSSACLCKVVTLLLSARKAGCCHHSSSHNWYAHAQHCITQIFYDFVSQIDMYVEIETRDAVLSFLICKLCSIALRCMFSAECVTDLNKIAVQQRTVMIDTDRAWLIYQDELIIPSALLHT